MSAVIWTWAIALIPKLSHNGEVMTLRLRHTERKLGHWGDDLDWDIGVLISSSMCSGHHTVKRTPLPHVPVIMDHRVNEP